MITNEALEELKQRYKFGIRQSKDIYHMSFSRNGCTIAICREEFPYFGITVEDFEGLLKKDSISFRITPSNPNQYYEFDKDNQAVSALYALKRCILLAEEKMRQKEKEKKSQMIYSCPFCKEKLPNESIKSRLKNDKEFTHCPECGEKIIL